MTDNAQLLADTPATVLNGVGAKFADMLKKLGIYSVQDLLFHLPHRYVDKTRVRSIASLKAGDTALIQAQVMGAKLVFGRRRSLQVQIEDTSGRLCLRFFHFNIAQKNSFEKGAHVRVFGELRMGASGSEIYHPEYEILASATTVVEPDDSLTPIYFLTDGVSQPRLRKLAKQAIDMLDSHPAPELLPEQINQQFCVSSLSDALKYLHFPPSDADQSTLMAGTHPTQQRLAFEELLAHFLARQQIRTELRCQKAPQITAPVHALDAFLGNLPFTPTAAQNRVIADITDDINRQQPMLRMVQGDVGSGKTLVAAVAALLCVRAGFQVALVAPTEILAEQHRQSFLEWFEALDIKIDFLVGKLTAKQKQTAYHRLAHQETDIVIGTHALFQDQVSFANLGLVIIDEQHRFGVHQRLSLREKSRSSLYPHQLVMTATPIPRTLAMTNYAELDFSIIDELPPGRTPIQTVAIPQSRKDSVIQRVIAACEQTRQCYWVCPLIEESETLDVANAEETYGYLCQQMTNQHIRLIHGRMKSAEKESIMADFKSGKSQVLVATTVIEVGVDVPNASIMVIENPERLGLSQLHQLRGRVGRGTAASHCILLYGNKLSQHGKRRLQVMRESNDGFFIAEQDLAMRGPGELMGTQQAGDMLYRVAHHERDVYMFDQVHQVGRELQKMHPEIAQQLVERWFAHRKGYALA